MRISRVKADDWYPAALRWAGLVSAVLLVAAFAFGVAGLNAAAAVPLVIWMLGYKTIHDFGREHEKPKPGPEETIVEAALRAGRQRR